MKQRWILLTASVMIVAALGGPMAVGLPDEVTGGPPYYTDVVVDLVGHEVRLHWVSDDGAFDGFRSAGCQVASHSPQYGVYHCFDGWVRLDQVTENGDGSTTYDFTLYALYGSPYVFELFGPNAIASVGSSSGPYAAYLQLSWTHDATSQDTVEHDAEPVLVREDSCIYKGYDGWMCTTGTPFGAGAAVVHPKEHTDRVLEAIGTASDVIDCFTGEELC